MKIVQNFIVKMLKIYNQINFFKRFLKYGTLLNHQKDY